MGSDTPCTATRARARTSRTPQLRTTMCAGLSWPSSGSERPSAVSEMQVTPAESVATDVVLFDSPVFKEDVAAIAEADLSWGQYRDSQILVTGASGMIPMYILGTLLAANDRYDLGLHVTGMVRNVK